MGREAEASRFLNAILCDMIDYDLVRAGVLGGSGRPYDASPISFLGLGEMNVFAVWCSFSYCCFLVAGGVTSFILS